MGETATVQRVSMLRVDIGSEQAVSGVDDALLIALWQCGCAECPFGGEWA